MEYGSDRNQYRSCLRKQKNETEAEARRYGQQAYLCRFCGKWHAYNYGGLAKLMETGHDYALARRRWRANLFARRIKGKAKHEGRINGGKSGRNHGHIQRQAARRNTREREGAGLGL